MPPFSGNMAVPEFPDEVSIEFFGMCAVQALTNFFREKAQTICAFSLFDEYLRTSTSEGRRRRALAQPFHRPGFQKQGLRWSA